MGVLDYLILAAVAIAAYAALKVYRGTHRGGGCGGNCGCCSHKCGK